VTFKTIFAYATIVLRTTCVQYVLPYCRTYFTLCNVEYGTYIQYLVRALLALLELVVPTVLYCTYSSRVQYYTTF
jgi:hypothetical protein